MLATTHACKRTAALPGWDNSQLWVLPSIQVALLSCTEKRNDNICIQELITDKEHNPYQSLF